MPLQSHACRCNHTPVCPPPFSRPCLLQGVSSDLEQLPCDWHMEPEEVDILKRPDGSDWQLGAGAFGVVLKAKRAGVQPVAVKASGVCCLDEQGWCAAGLACAS